MTLTETLKIEERYLEYEDLRAFEHCERRWAEAGCPVRKWEMVNFIECKLQELQRSGVGYPKVLLLRKKEIQRGTFAPEESIAADTKRKSTSTGESPPKAKCLLCRNSGWEAVYYSGSTTPSYRRCACLTTEL